VLIKKGVNFLWVGINCLGNVGENLYPMVIKASLDSLL
jgi:hypothetical protein